MAIIDKIEVTISSGGKVLEEYDPASDDNLNNHVALAERYPKGIVKYIEAIPGANFEINYSVKKGIRFRRADFLDLGTRVNGKSISSPIVLQNAFKENKTLTKALVGSETWDGSRWLSRRFCWRQLQTSKSISPE